MQPVERQPTGTKWVPTLCYMCYSRCEVKVEQSNGIVTDIVGHPDDPNCLGKLCAKGKAGIISLDDPYRLTSPLRRTNPDKSPGTDPGWQEISWDEAIDILTEKLKQIRKDDPRGLVLCGMDFLLFAFYNFFASAFGTPNIWKGGADYFCGNALHPVTYLTNGAFYGEVDFDYCDYCLLFGTQYGFMARTTAVGNAQRMADSRARGMKVVVVDPVGTNAASKADEWVSIRPGTDGGLALSMVHVLINELDIYDGDFLKRYTNAPYLLDSEGNYVREESTGKPMVWDCREEKARTYDQADWADMALEGSYRLGQWSCQPIFQLLKEKVKAYSPDKVSPITTVPKDMIRKMAREFGQAARIGSKIVIEGQELPLRPAVALWTRGAITHKHAMMTGMAIQLLNILVGAIDVPGGMLGSRTKGPFWGPAEGIDGLIMPDEQQLVEEPAFPARKARAPETMELRELFPISPYAAPFFEEAVLKADKYNLPYEPKALIVCMSNPVMSTANPEKISRVIREIPFVVSFSTHLDETATLADLVLPETHYLERPGLIPNFLSVGVPTGLGDWFWSMGQPVVAAKNGARCWVEVLVELADKVGFLDDFNAILNQMLNLKGEFKLGQDKRYTLDEISESWAKSWWDEEHDLSWFKSRGIFAFAKKKVEEAYPRPFITGRIPIYLEYLKKAGEDLKQCTQTLGLSWDTSDYQGFPLWRPCPSYDGAGFDLYPVNFKVPFHTFSFSTQNPWLNELAQRHPHAYNILINTATAIKRGITDGDTIWVESVAGKVKGRAKTTECIHPEVVGIAGIFGHWAAGMPVAKDKGVHFNTLLNSDPERVDMICAALDSCSKVRVYKV